METFGDTIQKVAIIQPEAVKIDRICTKDAREDFDGYICPHCGSKVKLFTFKDAEGIECRIFRHTDKTSVCTYYASTGVESDDHWAAKQVLKQMFEQKKKILIVGSCLEGDKANEGEKHGRRCVIKYTPNMRLELEYKLDNNNRADVAFVDGDNIQYIIEVIHTSETKSVRQEPWFQIEAKAILAVKLTSKKIILHCARNNARCHDWCNTNDNDEIIDSAPKPKIKRRTNKPTVTDEKEKAARIQAHKEEILKEQQESPYKKFREERLEYTALKRDSLDLDDVYVAYVQWSIENAYPKSLCKIPKADFLDEMIRLLGHPFNSKWVGYSLKLKSIVNRRQC
jgi:hypothetical protein